MIVCDVHLWTSQEISQINSSLLVVEVFPILNRKHHHVSFQLRVNLLLYQYILSPGLVMILTFSYRVLLLGDCCGDRSLEVCCLDGLECLPHFNILSICHSVRFTSRSFQPMTATTVGSWIQYNFSTWKSFKRKIKLVFIVNIFQVVKYY